MSRPKGKGHAKKNAPSLRGGPPSPREKKPRPKSEPVVNFYEIALTLDREHGHKLREVAEPAEISQQNFELCARMVWVAQHDPNCIGIAAPQVGVWKRIIVVKDGDRKVWPILNPTFEPTEDATRGAMFEGCFSLPDQRTLVERWSSVIVRGSSPSGDLFERRWDGVTARAVQHEIDHLDGILIDAYGDLGPVTGDVIATGEKMATLTPAELEARLYDG